MSYTMEIWRIAVAAAAAGLCLVIALTLVIVWISTADQNRQYKVYEKQVNPVRRTNSRSKTRNKKGKQSNKSGFGVKFDMYPGDSYL